jgi:phospholipase/lecithinase/hemolysin
MENPDDYYMGRFSNGPLWVEYLAQQLQLPAPVGNYLSGSGRNYAFGGAQTHASIFDFKHWVINDIDEQVPDFINDDGGPAGDELIVLWGGANDLFDRQTNMATPVNNLGNQINNLYAAGGRRFMVVNLPLLGQTPSYNGTSDESIFDGRSVQFNSLLSQKLDTLQTTLAGIEFFRVDAAALITSAITNPSAYGFTNVTDQALGLSGINADEYLFWDDVHPTTAAHRLLALSAAEVLFDALYLLPGDLDFDGFVGINDLNVVLGNWNLNVTSGNPLFGDPSGDGFVGIEDLNAVLGNWNAGTPGPAGVNAAIPEPGMVMVVLPCAAAIVRRKR